MFNLKHEPRLDGLRAIAILMVLVSHFAYFIGQYFASGFYGVNLFFVLSGFLITSILIVDSDKPFGKQYIKFIGRRSLRIFPIYYLTILVLVIINAPHVLHIRTTG
ncbi:MAG: acyltransferase [Flavipsychrobacter sp.]|nr:acyltransferase [Flavipsychrobacter sp.]